MAGDALAPLRDVVGVAPICALCAIVEYHMCHVMYIRAWIDSVVSTRCLDLLQTLFRYRRPSTKTEASTIPSSTAPRSTGSSSSQTFGSVKHRVYPRKVGTREAALPYILRTLNRSF